MLPRNLFRAWPGRAAQAQRYTPADVKRLMQADPSVPEAEPVLKLVATCSEWASESELRRRLPGLDWYVHRLPTILFHYRRGRAPAEIAPHVGRLASSVGVELTLDAVAELVARRLNATAA